MAIRCSRRTCKFNDNGWCTLDYVGIDEEGKCIEYELDLHKEIIEHNEKHAEAIKRIMDSNMPEKAKDMLILLHILTMKTDKGTLVVDEMFPEECDGRG